MQLQAAIESDFRKVPTVVRRRRLVDEHSDLVRMVASQISRRHNLQRCSLDIDDLFSVGILGLFEAGERFDDANGTPFRSFAEFRIKGAMLDEIRRRDTMPRRLQSEHLKIKRVAAKLERELGRAPSSEEIAEASGLSADRVRTVQRRVEAHRPAGPVSLVSNSIAPDEVAAMRERYEQLAAAITQLPERSQVVLDLYYHREMTLREIADVLGVTEGRVSQIKTAAVAILRTLLTDA